MDSEVKKDRERIKDLVEESLTNAKTSNLIRIGPSRLDDLIKTILFNIDNPNYVRKGKEAEIVA